MPTYDYQCQGCGAIEEIFMTMNEATEEIVSVNGCINCGNTKFKKIISQAPGIAFKGSGFYVNDNPKKR